MATYLMLLNWTDQGIRTVKESPKRLDAARKLAKDMGGDIRTVYLTQGRSILSWSLRCRLMRSWPASY